MLSVAICDDNEVHLTYLTAQVKADPVTADSIITVFTRWELLLAAARQEHFDIVLMDILWGNEPEGIQAACQINACSPDTRVIFATAYLEYATDVYDAKHFSFVLKTQIAQRLPGILKKVVADIAADNVQLLTVRYRQETWVLPCCDILYLERVLHTTNIYMSGADYKKTTESLTDLQQRLPDTQFLQCHASYLVNVEQISSIRRTNLVLRDESILPVSRRYAAEVQQHLNQWVELVK